MKDLVPKGTGNSRFLRSSIPSNITHEELVALLRAGTFPVDFAGLNADGVAVVGSAYNKANVLPDDVCTALGVPTSAEPKDAFLSLNKKVWREIDRVTSSKKWVVPQGIYQIGVFLLGGGQSGEGKVESNRRDDSEVLAYGGASGWGKSIILSVTPGQSINVVIGSGGVSSGPEKVSGGDTKFGEYATAKGGGYQDRGCEGGQDISKIRSSYLNLRIGYAFDEISMVYGGISGVIKFLSTSSGDYDVLSWKSALAPDEKNIFDPSLKVFGLGGSMSQYLGNGDTVGDEQPHPLYPYNLGEMGKGGDPFSKVIEGSGSGATYNGGNATGYGNGGGCCVVQTTSYSDVSAVGGSGSPGVAIIYV